MIPHLQTPRVVAPNRRTCLGLLSRDVALADLVVLIPHPQPCLGAAPQEIAPGDTVVLIPHPRPSLCAPKGCSRRHSGLDSSSLAVPQLPKRLPRRNSGLDSSSSDPGSTSSALPRDLFQLTRLLNSLQLRRVVVSCLLVATLIYLIVI